MSDVATMARPPVQATGRTTERTSVHPLLAVTLISFLLPITFWIGDQYLTPMRLLLVFTFPYLMIRWIRGDCGRTAADWLLFIYVFWMAISIYANHPSQLFSFTGSTGLTVLGGYLTARVTIRSAADFFAFVRFLTFLVVVVLMPMGVYEAVGKNGSVAINLLSGFDAFGVYGDVQYCCRLGLDRAQTVFVHPIHNGIFCSIPFALYYIGMTNQVGVFKRCFVAGLVAVATFTSVSSGAVLTVGFQGVLMLYAVLLYKYPLQWRLFGWGAAAVYMVLELGSTKFAFLALAEKLAFDSWNVYIRGLLYNVGVEQIMRTPILGFGYYRLPGLPYWMTGSMDNYWLQQAVSHGVLGFALPFAAFLYAIVRSGRNGFTKGSDLYHIRLAYAFVLTGMTLSMTTVAVWAEVQSAIFMTLGAGQFLFHAHEADQAQAQADIPDRPKGPVYTRFPGGSGYGTPALARSEAVAQRARIHDGARTARSHGAASLDSPPQSQRAEASKSLRPARSDAAYRRPGPA